MLVSVTAPAPAPKATPAKGRDRYLDTLRAVAIIRVVTYHAFGFAIFPWFPAMGVMFALAGTLMVRSIDKGAFAAVKSRFRRLLPVVWVFGAIWIPLMIWHDGAPREWSYGANGDSPIWQLGFWLLPVGDPPGSQWGEVAWGVLWYLKTYLWFVALSPLLLKPFRKVPWLVLALPFALLGLAEVGLLPLEDWWGSTFNDVLVYLGCWLIGFAHAEGIIKRLPLPALFAIGGAVIAAGIGWLAGPGNTEALEEGGRAWSVENSSLTLALYSFGVVFILMRYSSRMEWLQRHAVIDRIITIFNSRAVTIYLWHNAAILIAMTVLENFGIDIWVAWFPLTWVLVGVFVLVFGWVEDVAARRKPELVPGKVKVVAAPLQPGAEAAPQSPPVPPAPAPAHYGNAQPYGGDPRYANDPRYGDPRQQVPQQYDPRQYPPQQFPPQQYEPRSPDPRAGGRYPSAEYGTARPRSDDRPDQAAR
ncbi:hypothetical protein GCM10009539_46580 [Cryptosporangium japonicum]|uniref:Acyltransferase 3 domain-containing protein n=1 Tax=Cryptosporangium japonicum TaxID=80872 RepID=A0ABN0UNA1_9ACTN